MGTNNEGGDATSNGKAPGRAKKRADSSFYVITPLAEDRPSRVMAGPFTTIKKCRAAITDSGDYDIVCVRERITVIQKTMSLFKTRKG